MKNNGIKLFDVKWSITTAGPSPCNNERTEVFFFGCDRAKNGNPCKGCFNTALWDNSTTEHTHDPVEMAAHINKHAPNKYITIGGGEPTDQIENLLILCRELKKYGFHIMLYTWRSLRDLYSPYHTSESYKIYSNLNKMIQKGYIDMIVDSPFIFNERIYDEKAEDGTTNSVGSSNQVVWDVKGFKDAVWKNPNYFRELKGSAMKDIVSLYVKPNNDDLVYVLKENAEELSISIV
jgi:organic radical activating enzyme